MLIAHVAYFELPSIVRCVGATAPARPQLRLREKYLAGKNSEFLRIELKGAGNDLVRNAGTRFEHMLYSVRNQLVIRRVPKCGEHQRKPGYPKQGS